jgi:hypothetical protein
LIFACDVRHTHPRRASVKRAASFQCACDSPAPIHRVVSKLDNFLGMLRPWLSHRSLLRLRRCMCDPRPLASGRGNLDLVPNAPVLHRAAPAVKTRSILVIRGGGNKQQLVAMRCCDGGVGGESDRPSPSRDQRETGPARLGSFGGVLGGQFPAAARAACQACGFGRYDRCHWLLLTTPSFFGQGVTTNHR